MTKSLIISLLYQALKFSFETHLVSGDAGSAMFMKNVQFE